MVKPVVRSLMTVQMNEIAMDVTGGFAPLNDKVYSLLIHASIGSDDDERGSDLFHFNVCSPDFLAIEYGLETGNWQRSVLVIYPWSYTAVVAAIEKLCQSIEEPTWTEVATKLSRYMFWEFEDYEPNPSPRSTTG